MKSSIVELEKYKDKIFNLKAFIGFDGYIDELLFVIQNRISQKEFSAFTSIGEFGNFILQNKSSCSMEIKTLDKRIGGNGPILANALAELGLETKCIGTFGAAKVDEIFLNSRVSEWISVGELAHTLAFEFQDGKLMFGEQGSLNELSWDSMLQNIALEKLLALLDESSLIGITNWSQITNSNNLLRGILENCMPRLDSSKKRFIFFDIADPSNRSARELFEGLRLIEAYQEFGENVLGLNKKEANLVYQCLYGENSPSQDFEFIGRKILDKLNVKILVLHSAESVTAFREGQSFSVKCIKISNPKLLTGCGDNFNGGFCLGLLLGMPMTSCIQFGINVAAYFISHAASPCFNDIISF